MVDSVYTVYVEDRQTQTVGLSFLNTSGFTFLKSPTELGCVFERLVHALKLCREQTNSCSAAGLQQNKLSKHTEKNHHNLDQMEAGSGPLLQTVF